MMDILDGGDQVDNGHSSTEVDDIGAKQNSESLAMWHGTDETITSNPDGCRKGHSCASRRMLRYANDLEVLGKHNRRFNPSEEIKELDKLLVYRADSRPRLTILRRR